MDSVNFDGWCPIRVYQREQDLWIDWLMLGDTPLRAPFFKDDIDQLMRLPFHRAFRRQTPLRELLAWASVSPGLLPGGFVFHVSRCGSTLLAQALASAPDAVVLSEPPLLDTLLHAQHWAQQPESHLIDALRALLSAMGQRYAVPGALARKRQWIKLDAWHVLQAPLIQSAWPNTPWVFIYRNPIEVLVSQMNQRGVFLIPGALGATNPGAIPLEQAWQMSSAEYCARVLGRLYQGMIEQYRPGVLLLNYESLPGALSDPVLPHLGWSPDEREQQAIQSLTQRSAKRPNDTFVVDTLSKREQAGPELHELAQRWIQPHYDRLEVMRAAAAPRSSSPQLPEEISL